MEPLLAQYRHWLQFQTLLGISPFTVSSDGRTLRQTPAITVYAFITIAAFVLSLSILTYVEIVYGVPESGGSDTIWVVDSLENCIVAVIFDSLMLVSVLRRRQHCRFIEAFAEFHDRWMLQQRNDSSETSRTRNVRRMCVINGVLTAVYLVCISSSILLFLDYIREWDQVVFTMLHHMAITYEFVTLLHIWDFVRLLGDAYVRCAWTILLGGERSSSGGSSDDDPENVWLDWTAAFAVDLERTMCAFKNCFGVHVLLFQTRDILCITGVSFFLLGSYFNGRIRIANYIYMFTYLMPTMAKSMLLIVSMAELNEKVSDQRIIICEIFVNLENKHSSSAD